MHRFIGQNNGNTSGRTSVIDKSHTRTDKRAGPSVSVAGVSIGIEESRDSITIEHIFPYQGFLDLLMDSNCHDLVDMLRYMYSTTIYYYIYEVL